MAEDPEKTLRSIGRRIAEMRVERGLTQEEYAERCGWSLKYLQRIEAGRQNLSVRSLVKLANALRIRAAELFVAPASLRSNPGRPRRS